jgi:hypothetical protein
MAAKLYKFEHKGKTYSIPAFSELPVGVIRKARRSVDDSDKAFIIIEELIGEGSEELKAIDQMSGPEFNDFLTGWTDGAALGESSGS